MSLGARPVQAVRVNAFVSAPTLTASRRSLVIVAAQNSERRQRTSKRNQLYNRKYLDLVASSSRKVAKGYAALSATIAEVKVEADLKPVDEMLYVAFSNIDKAIVKGVIHQNTGNRRKAKLTNYRKRVLAESGIYTPASA